MNDKRRNFIKKSAVVLCSTPLLTILNSCITSKNHFYSVCQNNCIGCGDCVDVCFDDAVILPEKSIYLINISTCDICGDCEKVCKEDAIKLSKYNYAIEESGSCVGCGDCIDVCVNEGDAIVWERDYYMIRNKCHRQQCHNQCVAACTENAITIVNGMAVIDIEKCTRCGDCVPVCPMDAINPAKVHLDQSICTQCGECYKVCEYDAITKTQPEDYQDSHIDYELCNACGECKPVCPQNSISNTVNTASIDKVKCTSCGNCKDVCEYDAIEKI